MADKRVADEPVPLTVEATGSICVHGTRVTLESIVLAFDAGATPEEITSIFPSLQLADVYATITYYLRHREEVDGYLEKRQAQAEEVRRRLAARYDQAGLRSRLLTRLGG